ncbi:probable RNA-directed DNA polymerase from transposon BS [Trichonephila clavipes]|nr:probable RNA-directed DNA polymerase from transposon BS [Trichonephila clavipes]
MLSEANPDDDSLYKLVKSVSKNKTFHVPPLVGPMGLHYSPEDKVDLFADSLESSFQENPEPYDDDFIDHVEEKVDRFLHRNSRRHTAPLTSPQEIMDIILQLPNKKAPGKDGIKNIALKALPLNAITNITKIINSCLQLNYFPQEWKHALITVIPKPGKDKKFTENYRPISLISSLGKIFEKILLKKINSHCEENQIIPDFQHGFRQQTSTQHQLLRVTNHIINGYNSKTITVGLFLDVKKAFDRMWHDGLIYKMIIFNFPTYLIKIIHSYLNNRTFNVKYNNVHSSQRPILASTPQGSILSPALYNIYTSDFPTDNNTTVCLFADDAAILCTKKSAEEAVIHMQNYIMKLELWLTKWRIAINTEKTNAIEFRKQRTQNSPPTLQIFNQTIEWTFETKYLGLILNDKLTYSSHFKEITKKFWKKLYSLNDIIGRKSKLSLKNRLFVYKQYVRPLLLYGCAIWGSAGYVHIDNLQRLQNRELRTIARAPRFLPRYILHEELRVEPIHTIIAELASNFHSSIPYHHNATINSQNNYRNLPPSTHRMLHNASSLISSF